MYVCTSLTWICVCALHHPVVNDCSYLHQKAVVEDVDEHGDGAGLIFPRDKGIQAACVLDSLDQSVQHAVAADRNAKATVTGWTERETHKDSDYRRDS